MKLSIIINHYHTPEILEVCLKSLEKSLSGADFGWEIIVVDGATIEKTEEMMREKFPETIFIPFKKNVGFGKLVNAGIKKARGEFLFIINADIIIEDKKAISAMMEYLEKNKSAGLLGPKLLNINGTVQRSCFRFYTPLIVLCRRTFLGKISWGKKILNNFLMKDIFAEREIISPIPVDWLMGSAFMARKSVINEIGGLDENFFMYFEDVVLSDNIKHNGRLVYYPFYKILHKHEYNKKSIEIYFRSFFSYLQQNGFSVFRLKLVKKIIYIGLCLRYLVFKLLGLFDKNKLCMADINKSQVKVINEIDFK